MHTGKDDVYEIVIPKDMENELTAALKDAAETSNAVGHYTLTKGDADKAISELRFDPITIAAGIYVGKLIVSGVSSYFIRCALDRVAKKMQDSRAQKKGQGKEFLTVVMPDGSVEKLDPSDAAGLAAALDRISPKPSGK